MTNVRINNTNRTIEVSKSFYKKASIFKSEEYDLLKEARADFPNFKVVVKTAGKRKDNFKGLTLDYMKTYIEEHEEGTEILIHFYRHCGCDENGQEIDFAKKSSYGEIKKWFLKQYPIFTEYAKVV